MITGIYSRNTDKYSRKTITMNPVLKTFRKLLLLLLLLLPTPSSKAQEQDSISRERILNAARAIIRDAGTCALITVDTEGLPRVRTMDPFLPDTNFVIWLATNPDSRKTGQIRNDPRVVLYYAALDQSGYVTITGKATLVDELAELRKHWKEAWARFYPHRPEGYLLIRVRPEWLEVISYTHDIQGDPQTWQPPRIYFDQRK